MNSETKICQNCKQNFIIESEDFQFYEKMKVPAPTWCPECRLQRRLMWRNERTLYKRMCSSCGKSIISVFSPDKPLVVYCHECWWSDTWSGSLYGTVYDFSKPFFVQWGELLKRMPLPHLMELNNTNSYYINLGRDNKGCYFSMSVLGCENSAYLYRADDSKECFDSSFIADCELCYEVVDTDACSHVHFSRYAENCMDSMFLFNCRNVSNCLGCVNLVNGSYRVLNRQYSEDEYKARVTEITGSFKALAEFGEQFRALLNQYPHRYANLRNTSNVIGDNISNFRNCFYCFDGTKSLSGENCKYVLGSIGPTTDSYDVCYPIKPNFCYESQSGETAHSSFVNRSNNVHHARYTHECYASSDLFGCVGLRNKSYCILNKQYTKEQYEELVPRIIKHMNDMPYVDKKGKVYRYGEFFPPELSPFAYNETIAQEYFPLTKEQAIEKGYRWRNPDTRDYKITIKTEDLPDHIKDIPDTITNEVIQCQHNQTCNEQCTQAFKIIKEELQFYKRMNLPLPRLCPNCRHYQRLKQRNPLKLWHRKCQCAGGKSENGVYQNTISHQHGTNHCLNEFETSYASERPEIVYCEACYNAEVV